jgi:hypothetical protein
VGGGGGGAPGAPPLDPPLTSLSPQLIEDSKVHDL